MKCKFYLRSPNGTDNRCLNPSCRLKKCWFTDPQNECECFEPKRIEYGSSDAYEDEIREAKEARRKSLIKLELVQYPYSKAGPTVYLDDYQIAGPRAFGVGRTVASYELTKENLKDIQRIVTRELNRMNGIE